MKSIGVMGIFEVGEGTPFDSLESQIWGMPFVSCEFQIGVYI